MLVIMPPVHYRNCLWVDRALGPTGGVALDAARADGYTKFLVILTRERSYRKNPNGFRPYIVDNSVTTPPLLRPWTHALPTTTAPGRNYTICKNPAKP